MVAVADPEARDEQARRFSAWLLGERGRRSDRARRESGDRGHDLEGGAGDVASLDGAVKERLRGIVPGRGERSAGGGGIRDARRVVGRRAGHREHLAGPRVECHDCAPVRTKQADRQPLQRQREAGPQVVAALRARTELRQGTRQGVVAAHPQQLRRVGRLQARRSVQARRVAQWRAQRGVRIHAIRLAAGVSPAVRQDAAVSVQDPAADRGPGCSDHTGIVRVARQIVGAEHLPVACPQHQAAEREREDEAQADHAPAQRALAAHTRAERPHAPSRPSRRARRGSGSGAGPRSENASRSPTISPFTRSDDPP